MMRRFTGLSLLTFWLGNLAGCGFMLDNTGIFGKPLTTANIDFVSKPQDPTYAPNAKFEISSAAGLDLSSLVCQVNSAPPIPCQATMEFTNIVQGTNAFIVKNGSIELKRFAWTVLPPKVYVFAIGNTSAGYAHVFEAEPETGLLTLKSKVDGGAGNWPNWGGVSSNKKWGFAADMGTSTVTAYDLRNIESVAVVTSLSVSRQPRVVVPHPTLSKIYLGSNTNPSFVMTVDVNADTGSLSEVAAQSTGFSGIRGINISPNGKFLYATSWSSGQISIFTIDQTSGLLTSAGSMAGCDGAVGIHFDSESKFLFAGCSWLSAVAAYSINSTTGQLTAIAGSPFAAGTDLMDVKLAPNGTHVLGISWGGDVTIMPLNSTTGAISAPVVVQNMSVNGSSVNFHPQGNFVYFALYSAAPAIRAYRWSSAGLGSEVSLGTLSADLENAMSLSFF